MKKVTLFVVMAFAAIAMTSCDNKAAKKEAIMQEVETFFSQAEQKLATLNNTEEFLAFFNELSTSKSEFAQNLYAKYEADDQGNFKGFTPEESKGISEEIYARATEYNKKESAKCAEFLTPLIDNLKTVVDNAKAEYEANGQVSEETEALVEAASEKVLAYSDYDNVPTELQDRFAEIAAIWDSISPDEVEEVVAIEE